MSNHTFSSGEIRFATVALAAISALVPAVYYLRSSKSQESTPHVQTFRKFLSAYSTLRPQALTSNVSREFSHTVLPSSLSLPSRSLEPFQQHASMIFSLFSDFQMIPQPNGSSDEVHFCPGTNTVIAHCKMGGQVNGESEQGRKLVRQGLNEWWTECVLMVRMSGDGRRIVEVREFVNSARAEQLKQILTGVLES